MIFAKWVCKTKDRWYNHNCNVDDWACPGYRWSRLVLAHRTGLFYFIQVLLAPLMLLYRW